MSDYKRLTSSDISHRPYANECYKCRHKECNRCNLDSEVWERLAEYEDDFESGKIVRLPCKVGDTIYVIRKDCIEEKTVRRIHIGRNGWYAVYYGTTIWDSDDRLGKAWFFTREEAEKRLKELQE